MGSVAEGERRRRYFNFSGLNRVSCGVSISVSTEDDDDEGGFAMTDIGRESSSAVVAVVCNFILFFSSFPRLFVCLFVLFGGVVVLWGRLEDKYCRVWPGGWVSKWCVLEREGGREE